MDAPAATVGDAADLLHVEVDHVPGPARGDRAGLAEWFAVDVEVVEPVQAEFVEPAGDRRHRDGDVAGRELAHDPAC